MGCGASSTAAHSQNPFSQPPPKKKKKTAGKQQPKKKNSKAIKAVAKSEPQTPEAESDAVVEEKPQVVFVLGGPGAGKGTQCANIVAEFGWVHLSAGDLLRAEQATDSEDSALIKEYIKDGKIVPVEITIRLLLKAMLGSEKKRFLIDGFPRSMDNREGWERQVGDQVEELFCLNFECSMEELEKRLLKRGETSGRADDNIESIKKRFVAFQEMTMPVLDLFKAKGMLRTVNSAQAVDDVWADTKAIFQGTARPSAIRHHVFNLWFGVLIP